MVPKFYNLKLHSLGFSRNLHYFMTLSKILCKGKQDSAVSLFLYLDSVFKNKKTRPNTDGFRKNNVNYWVFREIGNIILHL